MTHTHHPYGELQNYICYIMLHLWLPLVSVFTAAMIDIDGIMWFCNMYCFYHVAHIISHQLRDETRMTSSLKALQIGTIEFDISEFFLETLWRKNWRTYQRGFEQNHHFRCTSCTSCRSFANAIAIPQWNDYNKMKSTIHMLQHMIEKQ